MAAAITEYINAYFKGGQHNRSASRHSSRNPPPPRYKSCKLEGFALIHLCFPLPPDVW